MCGLFLTLERDRPVDLSRARAATAMLKHRGPDGSGQHQFERVIGPPEQQVRLSGFLGHTRLSILDPDPRSNQPLRRGARTLVYNGEIYNFRAVRADLERSGAHFDTAGDTEVLLELVSRGGAQALQQARGMWAFALLDEQRGTLVAARDRYGKKPLFYFQDEHRLCMASEIAPILHYLGQSPSMVGADLDSFLRHGWLFPGAGGRTHIQGVRQVGAGMAWELDLAGWSIRETPWYSLEADSGTGRREPEELAGLLRQAVRDRLVADRRVGLLLSGGIDSSLVLAVLRAEGLDGQVSCFTGDAGKSDDARYAQACIQQLGIHQINVALDYGPTGLDSFLQVCRHQEKPFPLIGNVLAMPQLYAQIAAHDVPVVLDGTGGDEIFGGYWDRQHSFAMAEAAAAGDRAWLDEAVLANRDNPKFTDLRPQPGGTLQTGRPPLSQPLRGQAEDPAGLEHLVAPSVRLARSSDPLDGFVGSLGQALAVDAARGRLQEWMWQNDRNAMMSGIENRSPFLDHRLAPFMHSGYRQKFIGPWNKHELRMLFPAFVSLPTQWRRDKQGFRWVYSRFLRHNRKQVLELVAASRLLRDRVDVDRMLDLAGGDDRYLECSLLQRMLSVAGVEAEMGLVGAG